MLEAQGLIRARNPRVVMRHLKRLVAGKPDPGHLWEDDAGFTALMKQMSRQVLVEKVACYILYQYAKQATRVAGDVAELGVYKGGTAKLLAKVVEPSGKAVHLFDTFSGMPSSDHEQDLYGQGDLDDVSLARVEDFLRDCSNVRFHQGFFPDTAAPVRDTTFSLVHVDADIYPSVRDSCEFFYPRMARGGIMVFAGYGFITCRGGKQAVDEYFADKPERLCYLPTGQCLVTRV